MPQQKPDPKQLPEKTQKLLEYHNNKPEWDGKKTPCSGYTHKGTKCKVTTQGRKYCYAHSPELTELNEQHKQNYIQQYEQTGRVGEALTATGKGRAWLDTNIRADHNFANAIEAARDRTTDRLEATAIQRALGSLGGAHSRPSCCSWMILSAWSTGRPGDAIAALMQPGAFQAINDALTPQLVELERVEEEG